MQPVPKIQYAVWGKTFPCIDFVRALDNRSSIWIRIYSTRASIPMYTLWVRYQKRIWMFLMSSHHDDAEDWDWEQSKWLGRSPISAVFTRFLPQGGVRYMLNLFRYELTTLDQGPESQSEATQTSLWSAQTKLGLKFWEHMGDICIIVCISCLIACWRDRLLVRRAVCLCSVDGPDICQFSWAGFGV